MTLTHWPNALSQMLTARPAPRPRTMFRQGDVLIEKIAEIPADAKRRDTGRDRVVLAYGESTGHAHAIYDSRVCYFAPDDTTLGRAYIDVPEKTEVRHEEHGAITLEPGKYAVQRQRQWTENDQKQHELVAD